MSRKVIIHEDRKFDWTEDELARIQILWMQGKLPSEIASIVKQDVEDVALVLIHFMFEGEIEKVVKW